jgi:hypothetical protein
VIIPGIVAFMLLGLLWLAYQSGLILQATTALMGLLEPK